MRTNLLKAAFAATMLFGCDKGAPTPTYDPNARLLGERLLAQHGESVLAGAEVVVFDSGFVVGRGGTDPAFGDKVDALGVKSAPRLTLGRTPVHVTEYFADQDVEFAVASGSHVVVVDGSSTLTLRLLLGPVALDAVRRCEAHPVERVCKADQSLRVRLDNIAPQEVTLVDRGQHVAKATIARGWAIFDDAPAVSDNVQLEVTLGDGIVCNYSKWLIDPRDSCVL